MKLIALLILTTLSAQAQASSLLSKCDFKAQTPSGDRYHINGDAVAFVKQGMDGYTIQLLSGAQIKSFSLEKICSKASKR